LKEETRTLEEDGSVKQSGSQEAEQTAGRKQAVEQIEPLKEYRLRDEDRPQKAEGSSEEYRHLKEH
jgi:hypothetical protein